MKRTPVKPKQHIKPKEDKSAATIRATTRSLVFKTGPQIENRRRAQ